MRRRYVRRRWRSRPRARWTRGWERKAKAGERHKEPEKARARHQTHRPREVHVSLSRLQHPHQDIEEPEPPAVHVVAVGVLVSVSSGHHLVAAALSVSQGLCLNASHKETETCPSFSQYTRTRLKGNCTLWTAPSRFPWRRLFGQARVTR